MTTRTQTDVEKVTVSLPRQQLEAARRAVEHNRAASVSAYIATAMRDHEQRNQLDEVLAMMWAEDGAPTDEEKAWARQAIGLE